MVRWRSNRDGRWRRQRNGWRDGGAIAMSNGGGDGRRRVSQLETATAATRSRWATTVAAPWPAGRRCNHDGDGDGDCDVDGEGEGDGDSRAVAVFDGRGRPSLSLSASASWMSKAPARPGCLRAPLRWAWRAVAIFDCTASQHVRWLYVAPHRATLTFDPAGCCVTPRHDNRHPSRSRSHLAVHVTADENAQALSQLRGPSTLRTLAKSLKSPPRRLPEK